MNAKLNKKHFMVLLSISIVSILALILMPPVSQDVHYHHFADGRTLFGIPNFWNVISNVPFVVIGLMGLLASSTEKMLPAMKIFFMGIILTGLGSAWYHWAPDNASLLWDRLPMTVAFMSLLSVIVSQHIDSRTGRKILLPMLLLGLGSVLYWYFSEQAGHGDLRPYIFVQFYPIIIIPTIMWLLPVDGGIRNVIVPMIGMYVLAKYFEYADQDVYAFGKFISGHTIKHLCAAAAVLPLLRWERVYKNDMILSSKIKSV